MTLKRLLTALIAVALITGLPGGAYAASIAGADCAMASSVSNDSGCCGGAEMSVCSASCASPTAAAGKIAKHLEPAVSDAPDAGNAAPVRLFSRQPDTAPPKSLSG